MSYYRMVSGFEIGFIKASLILESAYLIKGRQKEESRLKASHTKPEFNDIEED